jgi:salicylate hydroxylase
VSLFDRNIVIVGAGIGGLTAALALTLRGAKVTLLEQAPEITEVGAGLQISPNSFAVLRALGLEGAVRATGAPVSQALVLRDRQGSLLARFPYAGLARPDDYLFLHRADLIDVLAQAARAAGVEIRLGQKVVRIDQGATPAVVTADGTTLTADLVIGADGLHSVVAPVIAPRGAPRFTGQVAWRAILPGDDGPAEAELFMAPGRHIVTYPLRGGAQRNIVAVEERRDWTEESWSREDSPEAVRDAFAKMGGRARDIINRIDRVHIWGLFRHPVADRWYKGNIAILGDAVHPTLPFLAQGASMAIEDAWVLARALDTVPGTQAALAAYQAQRIGRVRRTVDAASRNAWKFHLGGPLAFGAHIAMRGLGALAPSAITRSFSWLYDHDVTDGQTLAAQASSSTQTGT